MTGLLPPIVLAFVGFFIVSIVFYRRPVELVCAAFVLWGAIPYAAAEHMTGLPVGPHPATIFVVTTFVVQLAASPRLLMQTLVRFFPFFVAVTLLFAAGVATTLTAPKIGGIVKIADQVFVPMLAFWLVSAMAIVRPGVVRLVRNTIIFVALGEAVLALIQYTVNNVIFWSSAYATRYWFKTGYHRWMGATDHPLVLATLLATAIPLLCFMRGRPQFACLAVMATAIVVTQARTGIIAGAVGAIFVILASRASGARKTLTIAALAVGGTVLASSALATGLQDRIANDAGSAAARGSAYEWFSLHWTDFAFSGGGIDSSYGVATAAGLRTSFENAFIMYAVDIGVLFSVVYLIALVSMSLMSVRRDRTGAWFSVLVVVVICMTFSSLQVDTILGPLLFLFLAVTANATPDLDRRAPATRQVLREVPGKVPVAV